MKRRAYFALLLCLVLTMQFFPASVLALQAESSVNAGISTADIYKTMIGWFVIGEKTDDFDKAMKIYETYSVSLSLQSYSDAEEYYRYMQARKYLTQGEFSNASVVFRSLEDFNDSSLYAAYASGRIAEAEGRYGDAVSEYIIAANLNKKTGMGSDVVQRMLDCNNRISDEQKSAQYKSALIDYEAAKESGDAVRIAEVLKAFTALAGYQDADAYAQACSGLLEILTRKISVTVSANANSAFVSWNDTAAAMGKPGNIHYDVLWKPINCRQMMRQTNCVSPVTLTGLIPGTDYEITVLDADSESVKTSMVISVPAPQVYPRETIKFNRLEIAGIERSVLDLEYPKDGGKEKMTPLAVFQMWKDFLIYQPDNGYTISDLNNCALYAGVVFVNQTGKEMNVSIQVVLRSASFGTYQTETVNGFLLADIQPQMVCVNISDALQRMQDDHFSLSAGQYVAEIYMDGQFFCSGSILVR